MLNRIITGTLLIFLIIVVLFFLPLFYAATLFTIVSLYGFYEWLKVTKKTDLSIGLYLILMALLMLLLLFYHNHITVVALTYASLFICHEKNNEKVTFEIFHLFFSQPRFQQSYARSHLSEDHL